MLKTALPPPKFLDFFCRTGEKSGFPSKFAAQHHSPKPISGMANSAKATPTPDASGDESKPKRSYNRKPRIGKEQVGDDINFTDEQGNLHSGTLTDVSEGQKLVDGKRASTRKMLVKFTDAEGEKYASIEQTCIAPEGSKIDWSSIYCVQTNYSAAS